MAQGQRLGSDVDRKAPQDRLLGAVRDQQGAESEDRTELEAGPELSAEMTGAACSVAVTHFIFPPTSKVCTLLAWPNLRFRFGTKSLSELSALI